LHQRSMLEKREIASLQNVVNELIYSNHNFEMVH
jgi:hypothetical protein